MQEAPEGGYSDPPTEVRQALEAFNGAYSSVVDGLDAAWRTGANSGLDAAIDEIFADLGRLAAPLYEMTVPGTTYTYGPTFAYIQS